MSNCYHRSPSFTSNGGDIRAKCVGVNSAASGHGVGGVGQLLWRVHEVAGLLLQRVLYPRWQEVGDSWVGRVLKAGRGQGVQAGQSLFQQA